MCGTQITVESIKEEKPTKILEFLLFTQMGARSVRHWSATDKVTLKVQAQSSPNAFVMTSRCSGNNN